MDTPNTFYQLLKADYAERLEILTTLFPDGIPPIVAEYCAVSQYDKPIPLVCVHCQREATPKDMLRMSPEEIGGKVTTIIWDCPLCNELNAIEDDLTILEKDILDS